MQELENSEEASCEHGVPSPQRQMGCNNNWGYVPYVALRSTAACSWLVLTSVVVL